MNEILMFLVSATVEYFYYEYEYENAHGFVDVDFINTEIRVGLKHDDDVCYELYTCEMSYAFIKTLKETSFLDVPSVVENYVRLKVWQKLNPFK